MVQRSIGKIFVELDLDPSRYTKAQKRLYKDATSTSLSIEKNFKKLGIKSSAEFELMRKKAENAYNGIKNHAKATANDIVRAERAKNEQLKRLNEQQFGSQKSFISRLKENWLGLTAGITAAYMATKKIINFAGGVVMLGARYETLGVVMETVGHNAGYTFEQMKEFQRGLEKTGIAMIQARESLARMNQAQLDLSKSSKLARVAQDAAVIGAMNSSQAFNKMVYGIQSANVRVLRTIGINVSFKDSYKKIADQLGVTTESFSEAEKANIRLNAVLEAGEAITGAYESAMETAGKQIYSLQRYWDNLKVAIGSAFTPALAETVGIITDGLKGANGALDIEKITDWGTSIRITMISIEAEIMRFSMLLDKLGGTLTSAEMLLYAPGSALGFESSKKRFENAAKQNMEYERRYKETAKELEKLAKRQIDLEYSLTDAGKASAKALREAKEKEVLASKAAAKAAQEEADKKAALLETDKKLAELETARQMKAMQKSPLKFKPPNSPDAPESDKYFEDQLSKIDNLLMTEEEKMRSSYENRIQIVNSALDAKQISEQRASQLVIDLKKKETEELNLYAEKQGKKNDDLSQSLKDAWKGWASDWSSSLNDMLWNADATFDQILESFLKMITQMVIQKTIIEPLFNYVGEALGIVGTSADVGHSGGVIGESNFNKRTVPSSVFSYAPRLHSGLMPGEFPAILQKGEAIIPRNKVGKNDTGGTQIILQNPTFQDAETMKKYMEIIAVNATMKYGPVSIRKDYDDDGISRNLMRRPY